MPEPSIPSHETALLGMKAWTLVAGFAGVGSSACPSSKRGPRCRGRWLMDKIGIVPALVWVKLGLVVSVAVWVQSVWLLAVFVAIYIGVVVFNVRSYERMWSDAN